MSFRRVAKMTRDLICRSVATGSLRPEHLTKECCSLYFRGIFDRSSEPRPFSVVKVPYIVLHAIFQAVDTLLPFRKCQLPRHVYLKISLGLSFPYKGVSAHGRRDLRSLLITHKCNFCETVHIISSVIS